ncbi:NAD-dependent succinate-semialdehyde dehydrogenase [Paenalkalicoccus suaedae]|uniref:NAD-dependent succinate-semialdehyde dehydrogenase n=1 Tax=Paenalkalicoccus suaedae TaxID=2592382 RepID=A0A859FJH2_9BACI|nr:NAD-dependent succinate-semialdehyde dehydrogenase [Paenalkalicoccus suaedae]QKS72955.1 NAD-dependent succinate-semialdehyde dehydrogenase [Paenalkalicoccus suaedae]
MDTLLFINGEWTGKDLEKIEVHNPANGELVGTVPKGGAKEAEAAIEAAHNAQADWAALPAAERATYLMKWHDLILEQTDEIADMLTREMGKPLKEASGEVAYSASFIKWFSEEARRSYGRIIPTPNADKRLHVIKQPVGVVASITPWNFPAAMIARKMAPALAAGCTFVGKPAELTPLTAFKLAELSVEAGIPKGVINLVTGDPKEIGETFTNSEKVRKLTFTGSTQVGKTLMKQSAEKMHTLSLELGGHAPMIVCEDADLDKAVKGVIGSKFRNAGQTCVCGNRIYVHASVLDSFLDKFTAEVNKLKVGNGLEEGVEIGPLINEGAYEKVDRHVQDAIKKGANVLTGGEGYTDQGGHYYKPTVLSNITDDMIIMQEETFGPVAPVQVIESDEDAIRKANNTRFGLAAYFFTENLTRGTRMAEALEYGIVGWNDGGPSAAEAPFGGMKESGLGREGGVEGLEAFLETKYISQLL